MEVSAQPVQEIHRDGDEVTHRVRFPVAGVPAMGNQAFGRDEGIPPQNPLDRVRRGMVQTAPVVDTWGNKGVSPK